MTTQWTSLLLMTIRPAGVLTSLIRNSPPPLDYRRALGIILLQGPRGGCFLMGELPLWASYACSSA